MLLLLLLKQLFYLPSKLTLQFRGGDLLVRAYLAALGTKFVKLSHCLIYPLIQLLQILTLIHSMLHVSVQVNI